MLNGRLFGLILLEFDMEKKLIAKLVIEYLEFSYDEFCEWLDRHKGIEPTEAELIISKLKKAGEVKK